MKIRYYKKSCKMVVTMDNEKDTIIVVGGGGLMDTLTITNNTTIPMSRDFCSSIALLYYEHRNKAETPPISK